MNEIATEPICDCTDTRPFPQPFESIGLTNHIELIKVDELYNPKHNKFEMIRQIDGMPDLKHIASLLGVTTSRYDAYQATLIQNGFKLTLVDYRSAPQRNSIYFFINKNFSTKPFSVIQKQAYEIWQERAGADFQGSVYFPSTPNRFPFVMPSRGKIFR